MMAVLKTLPLQKSDDMKCFSHSDGKELCSAGHELNGGRVIHVFHCVVKWN